MKNTSLLIITLFFVLSASAQTPRTLNFQGNLTDPVSGEIIADGDYPMTVGLFDVLSGGSALWTEDLGSITVINGIFNVKLGKNTSLDPSLFADSLWLEIVVNSETLAPRIELASTAYSFSASSLVGDNFIPNSGNVHIGGNLDVGGVSPTIDLAIDDDDTGLEVSTDGGLSFYSNGIEKMYLDPGILEIFNSSFRVGDNSGNLLMHPYFGEGPNQSTLLGVFNGASLYPQMRFQNDTSSSFIDIGLISGNRFVIEDGLDNPMLTVAQNGNVGIGTATPVQKLSVNGNIVSSGTVTADAFISSTPNEDYYSISAPDFVLAYPTDEAVVARKSGASWVFGGEFNVTDTDAPVGNNTFWTHTLKLPDGAIITRIDGYFTDNNATYGISMAGWRHFYGTVTGQTTFMSSTTSSTIGFENVQRININHTIDNDAYLYFIVLTVPTNVTDVKVHNVKVTYTY